MRLELMREEIREDYKKLDLLSLYSHIVLFIKGLIFLIGCSDAVSLLCYCVKISFRVWFFCLFNSVLL